MLSINDINCIGVTFQFGMADSETLVAIGIYDSYINLYNR